MLRRRTLFSFHRRGPALSGASSATGTGRLLIQLAVISIILTSALGAILAWRLTQHLNRSAIHEAADETQADLAPRVARELSEEDLAAPMTGQRYADFQRFLEESILSQQTVRVKLWSRDGTVIYSDDPDEVGTSYPIGDKLAEALAGGTAADFEPEDSPDLSGAGRVLEVYVPLVLPGSNQVVGAFEINQDSSHLDEHLSVMRYEIFLGLGIGLAVFYVVLFVILHRGIRTIRRQQEEIQTRARETVQAVVAALDLRDTETERHGTRVADISVAIARQMGLAPSELVEVEIGALLHDVGKIGVPDQVLRKAGPLTEEEWTVMRRHPALGHQMLQKFPSLQAAARLVHAHHEHFDGSSYPRGLKGEAIPFPARIFAVADAYDAITSDRSYRSARSHEEALAELRRCAGSQFDPEVVRAFLSIADLFSRPASRTPKTQQADIVIPRAA